MCHYKRERGRERGLNIDGCKSQKHGNLKWAEVVMSDTSDMDMAQTQPDICLIRVHELNDKISQIICNTMRYSQDTAKVKIKSSR